MPRHLAAALVVALLAGCGPKGFEGMELHTALLKNENHRLVQMVKEHPEWVNSVDAKGNTPLHLAADRCNIEAAALLMNNGADVDAQNADGNTPFHIAAAPAALTDIKPEVEGDTERSRTLARTVAKTGAQGKIMASQFHKQSQILQYMIKLGANPKLKNAAGKTPVNLLGRKRYDSIKFELENPGEVLP